MTVLRRNSSLRVTSMSSACSACATRVSIEAKAITEEMTPRMRLAMKAPMPARTANGRSIGAGAPKPAGADGAGP
jgi:hypothetical protein